MRLRDVIALAAGLPDEAMAGLNAHLGLPRLGTNASTSGPARRHVADLAEAVFRDLFDGAQIDGNDVRDRIFEVFRWLWASEGRGMGRD